MDVLPEKERVFHLHSSFTYLRKQILDIQKGSGKVHKNHELLPRSYVPILYHEPFSDEEMIGKSFLEKETPFLHTEKLYDFAQHYEDDEKRERVQRLSAANIKLGNFSFFEKPTFGGFSFLSISATFLLFLHVALSFFEFFMFRYIIGQPFSVLNNVIYDPLFYVIGFANEIFGIVGLFCQNKRLISVYIYFLMIWWTGSIMMIDKYVTVIRLIIEVFLMLIMFNIRRKLQYKWFTTGVIE